MVNNIGSGQTLSVTVNGCHVTLSQQNGMQFKARVTDGILLLQPHGVCGVLHTDLTTYAACGGKCYTAPRYLRRWQWLADGIAQWLANNNYLWDYGGFDDPRGGQMPYIDAKARRDARRGIG